MTSVRLIREIGAGAVSSVWEGTLGSNRCAVKQVLAALPERTRGLVQRRLRREASVLARLQGRGFPRLLALEERREGPLLAMELLSNGSLQTRLLAGALSADDVRALAVDVARALHVLHGEGLIHRDLKPANVLFGEDGARVADLELSGRIGIPGGLDVVGTPLYAAPEQTGVLTLPVGPPADLYSLGAILFECATGQPPFVGANAAEIIAKHASAPVPDLPPSLPSTLRETIRRLLAKDPADRIADAATLLEALGEAPRASTRARRVFGPRVEDALRQAALRLQRGEGGPLHVWGAGGGGKTTLLAQLEEVFARAGWRVFRCPRGTDALQKLELALAKTANAESKVVAGAAHPAPRLVDAGLEAGGSEFEVIAQRLAAHCRAIGRVALFVDDLHLAEPITRAVVEALRRRGDAASFSVVTASDADALGDSSGGRASVAIDSLREEETWALAATELGGEVQRPVVQYIAARAHGNPGSCVELSRALLEGGRLNHDQGVWSLRPASEADIDISDDLQRRLIARIAELEAADTALLSRAALSFLPIQSAVLAQVGRVPLADAAATVARAFEAGVFVADGDGYRFVHPVLTSHLASSLDDASRRAVHANFARALRALGAPRLAIARHAAEAGTDDRDDWYPVCRDAAIEVAARFDDVLALRLVDAAEALDATRARNDLALMKTAGQVLFRRRQFDGALARFHAAISAVADGTERGILWSHVARTHVAEWQWEKARAACAHAFAALKMQVPTGRAAELLGGLWRILTAKWRRPHGDAETQGRTVAALHILNLFGYIAYFHFDEKAMLGLTVRVLSLLPQAPAAHETVRGHAYAGYVFGLLGLHGRARASFQRARDVASGIEDPTATALVEHIRAEAFDARGDVDGAEAAHADVHRTHQAFLPSSELRNAMLTHTWNEVLRGRLARATSLLDELARFESASGASDPEAPLFELLVATLSGDVARWAPLCEKLEGAAQLGPYLKFQTAGIFALARALRGEVDLAGADTVLQLVTGMSSMPVYQTIGLLGAARARLLDLERSPSGERLAAFAQSLEIAGKFVRHGLPRAHLGVLEAHLALHRDDARALSRILRELTRVARKWDAPWLDAEIDYVSFLAEKVAGARDEHLGRRALQAIAALRGAKLGGLVGRYATFASNVSALESLPSTTRSDGMGFHAARTKRHLDALTRLSLASSHVLDPKSHAQTAVDEILGILGGERIFLFLVDGDALTFSTGRTRDGGTFQAPTGFSSTVVRRVKESREPIVLSGTDEGEVLGSQSVLVHDLRSIIAAPIIVRDQLTGVIYIDSRVASGVFGADDLEILGAMATHIGIGLDAARTAQIDRERAALEKDLQLTAAVQGLLLPQRTEVQLEGVAIAGFLRSVGQSGGDWWWHSSDESSGRTIILLSDVTGHGASSAMVAALIAGAFHATWAGHWDPGRELRTLHDLLRSVCRGAFTATLSAVLVDRPRRRATWWSAAAPPLMTIAADGRVQTLSRASVTLGEPDNADPSWTPVEFDLLPGGRVVMFSDGLLEMRGARGRQVGLRGMKQVVVDTQPLAAPAARDAILERLGALTVRATNDEEADDITLVVIDCKE